MLELQYETDGDPQGAFQAAKKEIATTLSNRITDGLNEQIAYQVAQGLEPETNGIFSYIVRNADSYNSQEILVEGHVFRIRTSVALMKPKTQEGPTGSDLAIFFEVQPNRGSLEPFVSKTLLVQAKVGTLNNKGELSASDEHLPKQIKTIQRVSPKDGFLLVYTKLGAYCIDIKEAGLSLKGQTVRTTNFSNAGEMLYRLVICTSGNVPRISPQSLNLVRDSFGNIQVSDAAQRLAQVAGMLPPDEAVSISVTVGGDVDGPV
ncbi:hypothetical protein [Ralstonia pseudosolanacearum]|uniref:hypothetical protein n=1 Tax=Ralstonia pseudosolanacearum TaxID=1310165 RepID=UPI003396C06D